MSVSTIPAVSAFERLLDPLVTWGLLLLLTWMYDEPFTGYYLAMLIITFFISSYVYHRNFIFRHKYNGEMMGYSRDIFIFWGIIVANLLVINYVANLSHHFSQQVVLTWFIATPFVLLLSHILLHRIAYRLRKNGEVRTAIIVGTNDTSLSLVQRSAVTPELLIDILGYFDERSGFRVHEGFGPRLGDIDKLADYVREHNIKMVFISLPMSAQPRIREIVDKLYDSTASTYFLLNTHIFDLMQTRSNGLKDIPMVPLCETPFIGLDNVLKNVSDFVLALLLLILLSPLMLGIALAVKLTSPGPAFFKQRRYGLNGEEIIVYKFRSMTVSEDGAHIEQAQKNDPRLTKLGALLRRTSLDELPQFINVLQGRMSIVGPRPHAVAHNELYRKLIQGYMLRHKVKPGITGWAQVNGFRGETEVVGKMQSRINYDLDYLQNWSIWLDLWIIMRTVWVVLRRNNAH